MANITAIQSAKMWLSTSQFALRNDMPTNALYSAEMVVEIALKGVLMELDVDVPKSHDVVALVRGVFEEKKSSLPNEFTERLSFILETMTALLALRPIAGYAYERNIDEKSIKEKAKEYVERAEAVLKLCEKAVIYIGKGKRK